MAVQSTTSTRSRAAGAQAGAEAWAAAQVAALDEEREALKAFVSAADGANGQLSIALVKRDTYDVSTKSQQSAQHVNLRRWCMSVVYSEILSTERVLVVTLLTVAPVDGVIILCAPVLQPLMLMESVHVPPPPRKVLETRSLL